MKFILVKTGWEGKEEEGCIKVFLPLGKMMRRAKREGGKITYLLGKTHGTQYLFYKDFFGRGSIGMKVTLSLSSDWIFRV